MVGQSCCAFTCARARPVSAKPDHDPVEPSSMVCGLRALRVRFGAAGLPHHAHTQTFERAQALESRRSVLLNQADHSVGRPNHAAPSAIEMHPEYGGAHETQRQHSCKKSFVSDRPGRGQWYEKSASAGGRRMRTHRAFFPLLLTAGLTATGVLTADGPPEPARAALADGPARRPARPCTPSCCPSRPQAGGCRRTAGSWWWATTAASAGGPAPGTRRRASSCKRAGTNS